jgi:hypothetical protein
MCCFTVEEVVVREILYMREEIGSFKSSQHLDPRVLLYIRWTCSSACRYLTHPTCNPGHVRHGEIGAKAFVHWFIV